MTKAQKINIILGSRMTKLYNVYGYDHKAVHILRKFVKSIYKSGDKSSPSNYRPISLLPVFSKIYEKVIHQRLIDHLNNNAILNEHSMVFEAKFQQRMLLLYC
jgi:hypothetical protein